MSDGFNDYSDASFDDYQKVAADYRACLVRCQQAVDQLRACEAELKEIAATRGVSQSLRESNCDLSAELEVSQLSERELQVFTLLGTGLTTQRISLQLNLSISTIETYRERIKSKLGVETSVALARQAVLWASRNPSQASSLDGSGSDSASC